VYSTAYGVGGSTDGPQWDGVILRWNDPRGRRSAWANGGSDGLEGDGPLFVRTRGVNAINRDLVSIERSDGANPATPVSAKQAESIWRALFPFQLSLAPRELSRRPDLEVTRLDGQVDMLHPASCLEPTTTRAAPWCD